MSTMHEHPGLWYRVFLAEQGFDTLSASDLDKLTTLVGKEATDADDA